MARGHVVHVLEGAIVLAVQMYRFSSAWCLQVLAASCVAMHRHAAALHSWVGLADDELAKHHRHADLSSSGHCGLSSM